MYLFSERHDPLHHPTHQSYSWAHASSYNESAVQFGDFTHIMKLLCRCVQVPSRCFPSPKSLLQIINDISPINPEKLISLRGCRLNHLALTVETTHDIYKLKFNNQDTLRLFSIMILSTGTKNVRLVVSHAYP